MPFYEKEHSMATAPQTSTASRVMYWSGWVVTILPVFVLTMSGIMKLAQPEGMSADIEKLGWTMRLMVPLAIIELGSAALYLIPQTSVLGAILVTGYLGGATATHMRIDDPLMNILAPVIIGALAWLGLFLRDARIRELIPVRF
jgi:hypothetical protein